MMDAAKTANFRKTLAVAVVAVGAGAPIAAAQAGDSLDRYLANHGAVAASAPMVAPVSDVASSLGVARIAAARPTDALGRYLSTDRTPSSPTPISDNANSQMLVRSASFVPVVSAPAPTGFAWTELGIGAGTTLLLVVLAGAGLTLVKRRRELTA